MSVDPLQQTIRQFVAEAERLAAQEDYDEDGWNALHGRIEALDTEVAQAIALRGELVAPGRYLRFQIADGEVYYLVDRVEGDRVHCQWIANSDEYEADAVDGDGWTMRSIAERSIQRRTRW